jgi:hypothetical protein
MSRRCPFCHVVRGRICVSLQQLRPTDVVGTGETIHAPARGCACPALAWVVAGPAHWGRVKQMVAANKAALAWVPGGIGALQGVGWGPEFRVVTRARARPAPL